MPKGCRLDYPGRTTVVQIPEVRLVPVKTYGSGENLLIYGDNLHGMSALMDKYRGKVTLIYTDPPFATGNVWKEGPSTVSVDRSGEVSYEDWEFTCDYLDFLRVRLILMRELLSEEGSIYLHISTRASHYVKIIMDEVFGEGHFIDDICRVKGYPKNYPHLGYGSIRDSILFYSRGDHPVWNEPYVPYTSKEIEERFPYVDEEGRRYRLDSLHAPGSGKGATSRPWRGFSPPPGRHWAYTPDVLDRLWEEGKIRVVGGLPRKIVYADEALKKGKRVQDVWYFKDPGKTLYPTEKNLDMVKLMVRTSSREGDIVMDPFSGSGTTLIAAESLDRRWIGIDNSKTAIVTSVGRLRKVNASFTLYRCQLLREYIQV